MPPAISACMTSWNYTIIEMHTWAYKRNEKVRFWLYLNTGKRGSQLVCCTILISQLSLNVFVIWELSIQYNPQIFVLVNRFYVLSTQFQYWGGCAFFALLALNVIQTVLLQLKIIPCDSAYAWHTSSILCNQRTLGQNTQISSANIKWFNKTSPIHTLL